MIYKGYTRVSETRPRTAAQRRTACVILVSNPLIILPPQKQLTMQMKDKLGPEKPIQMSAAGKGVRSSWYRVSMVGAAAAIAGWWYWTREEEKKLQSKQKLIIYFIYTN